MSSKSKPTIVLLSASAGYGHTKAATSLHAELSMRCKDYEIRHESIDDFTKLPRALSVERVWQAFSTIGVLRRVYSLAHRKTLGSVTLSKAIARIFETAVGPLEEKYRYTNVVSVIALHPGAAAAARVWKRNKGFHLCVVATDLVVHGFQLFDEVDAVFCDRRAKVNCKWYSQNENFGKLRYTGLPVERQFFEGHFDVSEASAPLALVTFGAKGLRARVYVKGILKQLLEIDGLRVQVVCGQNSELKCYLDDLIAAEHCEDRVRIEGFVTNMSRLLHSASVVIGKPGGITAGEVLAARKPFVILDVLPGQEEYNRDALVISGLGRVSSRQGLKDNVLETLSSKQAAISRLGFDGEKGIESIATEILRMLSSKRESHSSDRPEVA
ncbi:MAG: hypothetical protein NXI27_29655 [Alphaproteobacteria bacterium]|nr:hypothetical protein [Alphaproteobacteria bacterium]